MHVALLKNQALVFVGPFLDSHLSVCGHLLCYLIGP